MSTGLSYKGIIRHVQTICGELDFAILDYSKSGKGHHRFQLRLPNGETRLLFVGSSTVSGTGMRNMESMLKRWARECKSNPHTTGKELQ